MRAFVALLACFALAACAGSSRPTRAQMERIDRALASAPGEAQPGKVVATELAFARAAKDDGQWTAFREFAAAGAQLHGPDGPVDAAAWLQGRKDPSVAVKWAARNVWMSCDATLAISRGRMQTPDKRVGTFVNVWQRQSDLTYKWIYAIAALDNPQPAPNPQDPQGENEILVTAMEAIQGKVADCLKPGEVLPPPRLSIVAEGTKYGDQRSADKTLSYSWEQRADGTRRFFAGYAREGEWQKIVDLVAPPEPNFGRSED